MWEVVRFPVQDKNPASQDSRGEEWWELLQKAAADVTSQDVTNETQWVQSTVWRSIFHGEHPWVIVELLGEKREKLKAANDNTPLARTG